MNELETRVYTALPHGGATILKLCALCGLWAADVVETLDALMERGAVERRGELFYRVSPGRAASIDQVINARIARRAKGKV